METLVVYSPFSSARLTYVLGWLMKERLQLDHKIVHALKRLRHTRTYSTMVCR